MGALSQQSPIRLIEQIMPWSVSIAWQSPLAYGADTDTIGVSAAVEGALVAWKFHWFDSMLGDTVGVLHKFLYAKGTIK